MQTQPQTIGGEVRGNIHAGERLDVLINQAQHGPCEKRMCPDVATYLRDYARERPEVVALWCFGIGFVLGWRLKPW